MKRIGRFLNGSGFLWRIIFRRFRITRRLLRKSRDIGGLEAVAVEGCIALPGPARRRTRA
jgi:hypothetical protein